MWYADAHCDISDSILYAYPAKLKQFNHFSSPARGILPHQIDLSEIKKANTKFMVWSICPVDFLLNGKMKISARYEEFLLHLHLYKKLLTRYPNTFELITEAEQLDESFATRKKIGVILHLEGLDCIKNPIELDLLYNEGIRSFGFCGITSNHLTRSGTEHPGNQEKISGLAKKIVKKLSHMPVAIDYAHLADGAFFEIANILHPRPIYVSHGNCRSLYNSGQNLTDRQLNLLYKSNGLLGITLFPFLLTGKTATIQDFMNHVKYAKDKSGIDHICIGSDFDGMGYPVLTGCESMKKIPFLLKKMESMFSKKEIQKIAFENLKKFFKNSLKK